MSKENTFKVQYQWDYLGQIIKKVFVFAFFPNLNLQLIRVILQVRANSMRSGKFPLISKLFPVHQR